jgi:transcriptional regulator with XRE-family HTH domain
MDKLATFTQRNPTSIARDIGHRMRSFRLAKGWSQAELAQRAGVSLSTLKLMETKGQISFHRLVRVAVILDIDGELRHLFSRPLVMESIDAVKRSQRQRAPRRKPSSTHPSSSTNPL